jgi:CO/xanthine dehydrogenase Mo-binding subunit/CO/xanthine dehydrogenase FAD-binding subunit
VRQVGQRRRPIDWKARTDGSLVYASDVRRDGMLEVAVLRSPYPLARIRSISTEEACRSPGVHAVIIAADFPAGARYNHEGARDRPPLADGIVRFIGQEVAAVAAETRAQAQAALLKIIVDYRPLAGGLTTKTARTSAALHKRRFGTVNLSRLLKRVWGEPGTARRASTIAVAGTYRFPRQAHVCMEPSVTVAEWDPMQARLHLWTATQAPYYVVCEISNILGLSEHQVVCHEVGIGGGFGARSKICEHEAIAAALARATGRPVRLRLSREEEFETTKSRHAFATAMRLHADAEGRLRVIDANIEVENGAYDHSGASVMGAGIKALGMLYRPDGVEVEGRLIDTAMLPGGSFRGYGTTQTSFPLECLMDELARKAGLDAIALRRQNANRSGETTLVGAQLGSARLIECLDAVASAIGWAQEKNQRRPGRGVGVAAGVHVSGSHIGPGANRSDAAIDIFPNGRVRIRFGGADAGTGQKTILAQIAAEELGVEFEAVDVLTMDSDQTPFDMGAWSSRGTHYGGHAVRKCAIETASRLKTLAALTLGDGPFELEAGKVVGAKGSIALGDVVRFSNEAVDGILTTQTSFVETSVQPPDPVTGRSNISASYNFAVHAAVVDVDRRTGRFKILDYVAAHDIGTAINPTFVEGQTIGGAAMGLGPVLGEDIIFEQGKMVTAAYINYALPRAADLPRIRPILIEGGDPRGPFGAKAIGECGVNPPPATIANAIFDAIGVRIKDLPITPDKILSALAQQEGRRRSHGIWRRPSRWWIALVRWAYSHGLLQVLHARNAPPTSCVDPAPVVSVLRPDAVETAFSYLDADAALVAGGTDLHPRRRQRLITPRRLVSLRGIQPMRHIHLEADGTLEIGATVTLTELSKAMRRRLPIISEAIDTIASAQIREVATIGGNLLQVKRCWFYRSGFNCYKRVGGLAPCYAVNGDHRFYHAAIDGHRCQATTPSDLATVFAALDAEVVLASSRGVRRLPISVFFVGPGETSILSDEILRLVSIPKTALDRHGSFAKLRLSEGDFALASAAITTRIGPDGKWLDPRIVLGALAPVPWRAIATEQHLAGGSVTSATLRKTLDVELNSKAHPLARNAWKLDAAAGLAQEAAEKILGASDTAFAPGPHDAWR